MSTALKALEGASRRELQALAKELQLCRGNAKSDVIVGHAMQFLEDHPKDGEQKVLGALGGSGSSSPVASPVAKKETPKKEEKATNVQTKGSKQQPEDEPTVTVKSVETKAATQEKKKTPTKKNSGAQAANEVTPKDKKKAPSPVSTTKSTPTAASPAKNPKSSVKASPSTKKSPTSKKSPTIKKSPTSKSQPAAVDEKEAPAKKEDTTVTKTAAPVGKKAEIKTRKAVEALVKSVPDLTFVGDARVRCSTTGHEMMADVDVIKTYISGKRYQKARNLKLSFAKFAPMFVDHPDESKADLLWCNVTESAIARDEKRVKDHIAAPKYQKQLPIWKEQEAAKKKAEEEEAQRRAARIAAARKRRLEAANEDGDDAVESKRPAKRARTSAAVSK